MAEIRKAILAALAGQTPVARDAPAGARKAFIPPLSNFDFGWGSGISGRLRDFKTKPEQLKANLGWVFAANSAVAEACAAVELVLYKVDAKGEREEVGSHEILDLLDMPNFAYTGEQMRQLHFSYMNLVGESYLLKLKGGNPTKLGQLPDALHILPSHAVEFKLGEQGFLSSYIKAGDTDYSIQSIVRDLNPNPENPYTGRSIIAAAAVTVDTDEQMKDWNRRMFANSARPSLLVEVPEQLEQEAFNRFKMQIEDITSGTENAHKPLILEGGAKASPYMMSQQDLDFLESRKFSKDEILAMFRVSSSMLGMSENVNRSNAETAEYVFAKYVVLPRIRQFVSVINSQLVKPFDKTLELDFVNPVPDDRTADLENDKAAVNSWETIDEVRERRGLKALPNKLGQTLYVPINVMPLSMAGEVNTPPATTPPAEPPTDGTPPKALPKKKEALTHRQEYGERKALTYNRLATRYERQVQRTMRQQFNAQEQAIIAAIDKHGLGKAFYKKGILDDLYDWAIADEAVAKSLQPIILALIGQTGKLAMAEVGGDTAFDPFSKPIMKFYRDRTTKVAVDLNDETEKQLKAELAEGIRNHEGSFELKTRVQQVMGNASSYRAERIGRTEVAYAQGFADIEAWQQSGVVTGKQWYTAMDEHVCPYCSDMDGKELDLETTFFDKGDTHTVDTDKGSQTMNISYTNIDSPPLHNNCRCVLLPITKPL